MGGTQKIKHPLSIMWSADVGKYRECGKTLATVKGKYSNRKAIVSGPFDPRAVSFEPAR